MGCLHSLVEQLNKVDWSFPTIDHTLRNHALDQLGLLRDLRLLILRRPRTFIILDGIDEAKDKEKVMELLSIFANKELENLHLLISSRPESRNIKTLDPMVIATLGVEGRTRNEDISIYIEHYFQVSATTEMWDKSAKREIRDWLVDKADGRYVAYFFYAHPYLIS